ncbi:MAG TPA: GTPase domain-containing protein [Thermoanaerobaculia bacterium]|nr:GTPase domain-containing protein [Thermoanaerobaculia bacterium]
MVLFNHATREMTAKIVYYGPGLCGKTTNLLVIYDKLDPKLKGKMLSLATKSDRTLFFDLLPVDMGKVGTFNLKIQLYTVPGQVFYNETRKLVLRGADAVVFVADSQPSMVESTRDSYSNLIENLEQNQIDPNDIPIVVQYNKRDIPGVVAVDELQERLGFEGYPYTEASAIKGEGVMETFRLISKIAAKHLFARLKGTGALPKGKPVAKAPEPAPPAPEPEPAAPAPESLNANAFSDSFPFFGPTAVEQGYEKAEEVSLDQLLEGRARPTFSGSVPVPLDDLSEVEELGAEELLAVPEEVPAPPYKAAVGIGMSGAGTFVVPAQAQPPVPQTIVDGGRIAALEDEVRSLQEQMTAAGERHRAALERIQRDLGELSERIRQQIALT